MTIPLGGSWGTDGYLVWGETGKPLRHVHQDGGVASTFTELDTARGELTHLSPVHVADQVLYSIATGSTIDSASIVARLQDGTRKTLVHGATRPRWISSLGVLVFAHSTGISAVRYSPDEVEIQTGDRRLASHVPVPDGLPPTQFDVTEDGSLFVVPAQSALRTVTFVDLQGGETRLPLDPDDYLNGRFSPDGRTILIGKTSIDDIWQYNMSSGAMERFIESRAQDHTPIWSPDGTQVIFSSSRDTGMGLYIMDVDKPSAATRLTDPGNLLWHTAKAWAPSGDWILFHQDDGTQQSDIARLWLEPRPPKIEPLLATRFEEGNPAISKDGRFLAYVSNKSGEWQVYVRPLDDFDSEFRVSEHGGLNPLWSPDGSRLYFRVERTGFDLVMEAKVVDASQGLFSQPRELFRGNFYRHPAKGRSWDLSPDGKQFFLVRNASTSPVTEILVIHEPMEE